MEIKGKIIAVLPPKSGTTARGQWHKQFSIQPNESVKVSFDPRAEQKNGHWYGSNRAWNVERENAAATSPNNPQTAATA